jgi:hypothetical protein
MLLKGAMRRRQVSKKWCLTKRWHGESPEACIALRENFTLTYLACYVSQSSPNLPRYCGYRGRPRGRAQFTRRWHR